MSSPSPSPSTVALPTSPETVGSTPSSPELLISGLRSSLASSQNLLSTQATRLSQLSDLEVEHQQLKDQYAFVVAAKDAVEAQLREEVKKREAAEERTEALRGQVEQARRGVMTLQKQEKERKRMSMAPGGLGLNTGGEETLEMDKDGMSSRTSILGRGHRRVSSHSEPDMPMANLLAPSTSPTAVSPVPRGLRELRLGQLPNPLPVDSSDLASARTEADRLRSELATIQARLAESEESRMASETVLKALREFVGGATGVVDLNDPMTMEELRGISLPPLPTDPDEPPPEPEERKAVGGWGFNKLWKPSTTLAPPTPGSPLSNAAEAPATPYILSPPRSVRSNSTSRVSPLPTSADLPLNETSVNAMPSQTPLASFVSSWTKTVPPGTPAPTLSVTQRSFSSFFRKGKEKDLPPNPISEAGSLGAERADESSVLDMSTEMSGLGLEPSPMMKDGGSELGGMKAGDGDEPEPSNAVKDTENVEMADEEPVEPTEILKDVEKVIKSDQEQPVGETSEERKGEDVES